MVNPCRRKSKVFGEGPPRLVRDLRRGRKVSDGVSRLIFLHYILKKDATTQFEGELRKWKNLFRSKVKKKATAPLGYLIEKGCCR